MKRLAEVVIDAGRLPDLLAAVESNAGSNPACRLGPYWKSRRGPEMLERVAVDGQLPGGFVGSGWPEKIDQSWALARDERGLAAAFHPDDLNTRDAGDAVYQANAILDHVQPSRAVVVDIGAGYGRLALALLRSVDMVIGVDYAPIGLLVAPQVVAQLSPPDVAVTDWTGSDLTRFTSLPAWRLDRVPDASVDAFVSIHSFQEMEPETIAHYVAWMRRCARRRAVFYSVNLGEPSYVPRSWVPLLHREYPINRDGSFYERAWRIA